MAAVFINLKLVRNIITIFTMKFKNPNSFLLKTDIINKFFSSIRSKINLSETRRKFFFTDLNNMLLTLFFNFNRRIKPKRTVTRSSTSLLVLAYRNRWRWKKSIIAAFWWIWMLLVLRYFFNHWKLLILSGQKGWLTFRFYSIWFLIILISIVLILLIFFLLLNCCAGAPHFIK